jgi:hypothetical protein
MVDLNHNAPSNVKKGKDISPSLKVRNGLILLISFWKGYEQIRREQHEQLPS